MTAPLLPTLLATGFRHRLTAANAEEACERFARLMGGTVDPASFHAAVAEALAQGLIREPVRLPEGSLQCHWHLELTPAGVAAVRALAPRG